MEKDHILKVYSEFVLDNNRRPESVYSFAKALEIEENEFYNLFTGFEEIEEEILNHFIQNAVDLTLHKEKEEGLEHKEALLTFYFTLVEVLKTNRSLVKCILPLERGELMRFRSLKFAKRTFLKFIDVLQLEAPALSFIPNEQYRDKAIATGAWMQFCSIVLFWLKDSSKGFEKTDVFIEKSLRLSFDLTESRVMESFIDLGKFMFSKS
jgi:succinate dehydrogenase flavin-adding protein (antitoxin of CptAB toxin-antitoxin module)